MSTYTGKQFIGRANLVAEAQTEDLTPTTVLTRDEFTGDVKLSPISSVSGRFLNWATPQQYGATGTGLTDDTDAVQQCMLENDNVFFHGVYLVTDTLLIRSNQFIFSNNATIKNVGVTGDILYSDNKDSWQIGGKLLIKGGGNLSGSQRGIFIEGRSYFVIEDVTFEDIAGNPIETIDGSTGGFDGLGLYKSITHIDCYGGVVFGTGAEYHTVMNIQATNCATIPLMVLSGNVSILGGNIVYNANGLYVGGTFGTNNSHGIIQNLHCNHNTDTGGYNAFFENVELGESIRDCHFYGDASNNIRIHNSKGVSFAGCDIYGKVDIVDSTPANNWNTIFSNCLIGSTTTFVGDIDNLKRYNNYTLTGAYPDNDTDPTKANIAGGNDFTGDQTIDGKLGVGTTTPASPFVVSNNGDEGFEVQTPDGTSVYLVGYNRSAMAFSPMLLFGSAFTFNQPITASAATVPTELATLGQVNAAVTALETDAVLLTGNQVIAGEKEFTGDVIVGEATNTDSPVPLWQANEIIGKAVAESPTTVALTVTDLTTDYPDAKQVNCPAMTPPTIYNKVASGYIVVTGTLIT